MKVAAFVLSLLATSLCGCNSLERHASVQKESLVAIVDATPVGTSRESARANLERRGWKITSDTEYVTNWPIAGEQAAIDSLITVNMPSRVGVPFRILVIGYVGLKDGKVVRHTVQVDQNAL